MLKEFSLQSTANWPVAWHQDLYDRRSRAARRRRLWPLVNQGRRSPFEPPFDVMRDMVTMQAHLDKCGDDNEPLMIALDSHRLGGTPSAEIADLVSRLPTTRCLAEAGNVWVYATPTVHASKRTRGPARRRVLQGDFCARELPGDLAWLEIGGKV